MKETVEALRIGEVLEYGKLFPGMTAEPIVWRLIQCNPPRNTYTFELFWCDLPLGKARIDILANGYHKVTQL